MWALLQDVVWPALGGETEDRDVVPGIVERSCGGWCNHGVGAVLDSPGQRAEPAFLREAGDRAAPRRCGFGPDRHPRRLRRESPAGLRSARAEVRSRVWLSAGKDAPDADGQVTVDLDGVLVIAHSDKQDAAATWKKTYGHHPLTAFVDHGPGRNRRARRHPPATGKRGLQHRRRPHHHRPTRPRPAAQALPARAADADSHRIRRRHARLRVLARETRTMAVLLGRHDGHRSDPRTRTEGPRLGLDLGRRDRR